MGTESEFSGVRCQEQKKKRRRHGAVICSDLEVPEIQRHDVPFKSHQKEVMNYLKSLPAGPHVFGIPEMVLHRDFFLKPDT